MVKHNFQAVTLLHPPSFFWKSENEIFGPNGTNYQQRLRKKQQIRKHVPNRSNIRTGIFCCRMGTPPRKGFNIASSTFVLSLAQGSFHGLHVFLSNCLLASLESNVFFIYMMMQIQILNVRVGLFLGIVLEVWIKINDKLKRKLRTKNCKLSHIYSQACIFFVIRFLNLFIRFFIRTSKIFEAFKCS